MIKGSKTLWANIGAHQFHLPEGKPAAQVLNGVITLLYPNTQDLIDRYHAIQKQDDHVLLQSKFSMEILSNGNTNINQNENVILITDPWGTRFKIMQSQEGKDDRGVQKGTDSLGLYMKDITFYTPINTNFEGIARFYRDILGAPILQSDPSCCVVSVGPYQTLSFVPHPDGVSTIVSHDDLRDESPLDDVDSSKPYFPSNYGPHISIYVADNIRSTYKRAQAFGVTYVNPRFKRRAYNEEEVVDDCMV